MSVENFIQESFFSGEEAIFASVPTITPIRARKKQFSSHPFLNFESFAQLVGNVGSLHFEAMV